MVTRTLYAWPRTLMSSPSQDSIEVVLKTDYDKDMALMKKACDLARKANEMALQRLKDYENAAQETPQAPETIQKG